jgi:uncharacterized protein (TIGR03000 family)
MAGYAAEAGFSPRLGGIDAVYARSNAILRVAIAVACLLPSAAFAGHGGGGGGSHGGGSHGGGSHGGGGSHSGSGGWHGNSWGYGRGFYGYGRGFYGYGGGHYGFGFPGYWPYYGSDFGGGYPYYGFDSNYFDNPALFAGAGPRPGGDQRFYPPEVENAPYPVESDRALVLVHLPPDAQLLFQGTETKLTGPARVFRSPPLEFGKTYRYDVQARWLENGKPVEKSRAVTVRAGERFVVDLLADDSGAGTR